MPGGNYYSGLVFLFFFNISVGVAQDIVLSSRWFHPKHGADKLNTISSFYKFNADRIDWMYCENSSQLKDLKINNIKFSLTLNPHSGYINNSIPIHTRMVDINGKPYSAPWMIGWEEKNFYWACVNNPVFQEYFIAQGKKVFDSGAYGVMVDDARFNDHAIEWGGGCFCSYCIKAFSIYLIEQKVRSDIDFDYKSFLKNQKHPNEQYKLYYSRFQSESVVRFMMEWKQALARYAKGKLVFLTNNSNGQWNSIYKVFDVGIAEMKIDDHVFKRILSSTKTADSLKKKQVFSFASEHRSLSVMYYLYAYLKGAESLLPWDLWLNDPVNKDSRLYIDNTTIYQVISFIRSHQKEFKNLTISKLKINAVFNYELKCKDGNTYLILLNHRLNDLIDTSSLTGNFDPIIFEKKQGQLYEAFVILKKRK